MRGSDSEQWRQNVAAVILDDGGNVLLGTTPGKSPYWHFPQGGVEKGETLRDAVLREVREEAGLLPEQCSILAAYGGLRYCYRHKNKKSHRWKGQEQTYFLIRYSGICSHAPLKCESDEFDKLRWMPWRELTIDLFVPFKREAVQRALAAFFPPDNVGGVSAVAAHLSPFKYLYQPADIALIDSPSRETSLFGGGKEEMTAQMEDIALRINRIQRHIRCDKFLVILAGLPGCGLKKALRKLAHCMDPMHTHAVQPPSSEALTATTTFMPRAGESSLLCVHPYADALSSAKSEFSLSPAQRCEAEWSQQSIRCIRIFMHISYEEHLKRADSAMSRTDWKVSVAKAQQMLELSTREGYPWYVLPADCRWYRDFVLASLVAESLEMLH